ncbi:MAG: DUF4870 domain-containing protein, partial [Vulcanimicrobiaceae bacterium]
QSLPTQSQRDAAMYAHLGGLLILTSVPFANVAIPLYFYLRRRQSGAYVEAAAKTALNFQATVALLVALVYAGFAVLFARLATSPSVLEQRWAGDLVFALPAILIIIALASSGYAVAAAIAGHDGRAFRYPLAIPFVR